MRRTFGPSVCQIGVAVAAVALAATASREPLLAAPLARGSSATLNVRLAAWAGLPALSTRALTVEAESIWRRSHVRLRWLTGDASPGTSLRVLVTPQAVTAADNPPAWTVGELLRFEGTTAIAVASIAGAQRIVDESRRFRLLDLPANHDYRLGVVLGRAVAHEIGHYLLRTNTHAASGLMRASIDAREFADVRSGAFQLDPAAAAHLAAFANRGSLTSGLPDQPFTYTP